MTEYEFDRLDDEEASGQALRSELRTPELP